MRDFLWMADLAYGPWMQEALKHLFENPNLEFTEPIRTHYR